MAKAFTPKQAERIEDALRVLLDIAEDCYPKYYQCDQIAAILDLDAELFGDIDK